MKGKVKEMENTYNIYFSDLKEEAQKSLLDFYNVDSPKDLNYDVDIAPIAVIYNLD